ncbi:MAG: TonB-dependent receptor, partial [Gammaproteobacteria bacterium]
IRGPASALYGPDALAGVINIITRRAEGDIEAPFRLTPRLRALDYNSVNNLYGSRVELEGLGNKLDMLLGVNTRSADNYQSPQGEIPNSDFATRSADLRLGYTPVPGQRLELSAKFAEVEAGRAGGISGAPGAPFIERREDPLRERFIKLHYSGNNAESNWQKLEASLYARDLFTDIDITSRAIPNRLSEVKNIIGGPLVIGGKLLGVRPWGNSLLTVGTDFFHQMGTGTQTAVRTTNFNPDGSITNTSARSLRQTAPDNSQTDVGLFANNDWDPSERWTVSLSGRLDYIHSTTDTQPLPDESLRAAYTRGTETTETPLTGGLGVIYRPWQTLHFTGNVSKAFRAPTTTESFGASRQGSGFLVPNPQLESEQGVTYELGTRLRLANLKANLTAFYSDYSNLIVNRPLMFLGLPSTQRVNGGAANIHGLEFAANWQFARRWEAFMNAAYLHGTDSDADQSLAYIPPLNGLLGLRYNGINGFFIEGVGKWSLHKGRIDPAQERETAGFAVVDMHAGIDLWRVSSRLPAMQLSIGLENIFDKAYRQPTTVEDVRFARSSTNPLVEPGRAVSITLRSQF